MRKGVRLPRTSQGRAYPIGMTFSPELICRSELAWAAGFFDGEGSIFPTGTKKHPRIAITQAGDSCPEVLDRFRLAVGGLGYVRGPVVDGEDHQLKWFYNADGFEPAQAIVAMLWTWVGDRKRRQAQDALASYHAIPHGRRWPGTRSESPLRERCKRGHSYENAYLRGRRRECRRCKHLLYKAARGDLTKPEALELLSVEG